MSFFKNLGLFTMLTAKNKKEFGIGAGTYLINSLDEEMKKSVKEQFLEDNGYILDEWTEIIQELDIPTENKKKAIALCDELRTAYNDRLINKLVKQINELTGCNFE